MPETTPEVTWAQRSSATVDSKNIVYVSINAPDVSQSNIKLDVQPTSISFSGRSETKKVDYAVKLDLFAEIDPAESKTQHSARGVDLVLRKKELKEEYWPRLTKEKAKLHFLKTDFDKWVDEDEQNEQEEDFGMGGMGGMPGMGGMDFGGMGGMGGMNGLDFSKLGGGMPDMGGMGEEDGDEEMPDLDDDAEEAETGKGKGRADVEDSSPVSSKIEEVE